MAASLASAPELQKRLYLHRNAQRAIELALLAQEYNKNWKHGAASVFGVSRFQ